MPQAEDKLPQDLQWEIRQGRKFSLGEAIGREGSSFLKGSQAMVPRPLRALAVINGFIDRYLDDANGALQLCLKRWVKTDIRVGKYLDEPIVALQKVVLDIVQQPQVLYEFARQIAVEWGRMNGERPYFPKPGIKPNPEIVYTYETIQQILAKLLERISDTKTERILE
ncbi:MAG: hypothetical protein F6K11_11860 [Leptolyngbya sp. SIO3F4]|nr:hypothetical protein [Leptolyngbya sp. SIO3F4]